ncbi:hypothetical protein GO013_07395 [Pseudodesulfovibrio sp. JC047]|uniref:hypothetical protein n=1 Tax=Pseudodesulfovibrio sp. JC047 TaxID=2683199 RepID=UPI0013D70BB8|nr:hypothetical protein [Pseudodesulfovibrio sp. JC047]NDV19243.1 hypothetical protein [Pseudodesulfovibrio sp. JC047]
MNPGAVIYAIGYAITFFYLVVVDWHETSNFLSWLFCAGVDVFLATIWPVYWAILHWVF